MRPSACWKSGCTKVVLDSLRENAVRPDPSFIDEIGECDFAAARERVFSSSDNDDTILKQDVN